jgi:hypothetical protein
MQSRFGCGYLFGIPTGGSPIMFAALQDVSVDFTQDLKTLHGSQKFPIELAGGKAKIEGKCSVGRIDPVLFNSIYFGGSIITGGTLGSMSEDVTIPATSPYTVTCANAAQFRTDLGVFDNSSATPMTRVPSAPATGQYSVNETTGVFTFAAADQGKSVQLYYTYGSSSTDILTINGTNEALGSVNTFKAVLSNSFRGKQTTLILNTCISTKFSMPFKQDDFLIPSFNFSAQDDGSGNIFTLSSHIK